MYTCKLEHYLQKDYCVIIKFIIVNIVIENSVIAMYLLHGNAIILITVYIFGVMVQINYC